MDSPEAAFQDFIAAFNALDWPRFAARLAPEVSLFPPANAQIGQGAGRLLGVQAVSAHFRSVFSQEQGGNGPGIHPVNVHIEKLAEHAALITFEFARAAGSVGRRSMVLVQESGAWKILHLHASNSPGV